jgi:hypothetical protein
MALDPTTFEYMAPSDAQVNVMAELRQAAAEYAEVLEGLVPDGPDKTFCLRQLRTVAMWANVAVTRAADGAPREDEAV